MDFDENRAGRKMTGGRSQRARYLLVASAVASTLWLIAGPAVTWAQHEHTTSITAPAIGAQAVDFELKLLDGKSVSLQQWRGKPVVINFFAS
ncbi:MAG TPA: redoxin domain-containing protein, partial [Candidatus Limnocylindrales bacterium]|nr:redoxin domain-containing protein [Candidatus Limnocylindrales bacterium]